MKKKKTTSITKNRTLLALQKKITDVIKCRSNAGTQINNEN